MLLELTYDITMNLCRCSSITLFFGDSDVYGVLYISLVPFAVMSSEYCTSFLHLGGGNHART